MFDPFLIPAFCYATENNLQQGILKDSDRRYMVQTLATLLMSHVPKPSISDCLIVCKALHAKFPFLKEDEVLNSNIFVNIETCVSLHVELMDVVHSQPNTQRES